MIRFKAKPDETPAVPASKAAKAASKAKLPSTDAATTQKTDLLDLDSKQDDSQD